MGSLPYEWGYQHGALEVYDAIGRHMGEFDPDTGHRLKPANPRRRIDPLLVVRHLRGYDKTTEFRAVKHRIPDLRGPSLHV